MPSVRRSSARAVEREKKESSEENFVVPSETKEIKERVTNDCVVQEERVLFER